MKRVVLVVDDSADYRRIITRVLAAGDFRALTAASAEDARLILQTTPLDAVLLDWNLPGDSGIDLAREIRRDARLARLPLIMLSVNSRPQDQVQGLAEGGVNAYLTKPVNAQELLARLNALLKIR